jgi:hypothetical protein
VRAGDPVSGHRPPSPWLFLGALVLGLGLLRLAAWTAREAAWAPAAADYFDASRLDRFRGPGPVRVAVVGSSLVSHALLFDEVMEALGRSLERPLRFVRCSRNGRRLDLTPALLAHLAAQPPDLLVLEAEPLVWGEPPEPQDRLRRAREKRLFGLVGAALARAAGSPLRPGPGEDANRPLVADGGALTLRGTGFVPREYAAALGRVVAQDPARLEAVLAGLATLERRGCRVLLLAFGRSPAAAAQFPPALARDFAAGLDRLGARGFRVERQDCPLDQDCYLDQAHLNHLGRQRFSAWFLEHVDRWREGPALTATARAGAAGGG